MRGYKYGARGAPQVSQLSTFPVDKKKQKKQNDSKFSCEAAAVTCNNTKEEEV